MSAPKPKPHAPAQTVTLEKQVTVHGGSQKVWLPVKQKFTEVQAAAFLARAPRGQYRRAAR